jgi:hypothetical protein
MTNAGSARIGLIVMIERDTIANRRGRVCVNHTISVSGQGATADGLAADLAGLPGVVVEPRRSSDRMAMDPAAVTLVVAGLGSVNALIAALGGMWAARISSSRGSSDAPVQPVLHLHTDLDEIRVTIRSNGEVIAASGRLPDELDDITEVHLSTEPA